MSKRYSPNPATVIFAPVVATYTFAKHGLTRLNSASNWVDANEAEIDEAMTRTLDAGLGVISALSKGTLVASTFAEGFVESVCEHNNVPFNSSRKEQVAAWKATCNNWWKKEEEEQVPQDSNKLVFNTKTGKFE